MTFRLTHNQFLQTDAPTAICRMLIMLVCTFIFCELKAQKTSADLLTESHTLRTGGDWEKAAEKAVEAFKIAEKTGEKSAMGLAAQAEGLALMQATKRERNNRKKATERLETSLLLLNTTTDRDARLLSLEALRDLAEQRKDDAGVTHYEKQMDLLRAAESTQKSLSRAVSDLAQKEGLLRLREKELTRLQLETELMEALSRQKVDSLRYKTERDSLALVQSELMYQEQSVSLELERSQRYLFMTLLGVVLLLAVGIFWRYRETKRLNGMLAQKNQIIDAERQKSEELLLNILPQPVAAELKLHGVANARRYEQTTVFFSDFVNFTTISSKMNPEDLVEMLDDYFKTFDAIITRHGLEKIKTIGDAYMCVGGLPHERPDHAESVIKAALEIQRTLAEKQADFKQRGRQYFEARIGVHTGPVVAGVVGSKKFAFDIWGDTVNVASRMEQSGQPGRVNISAATHELVKDKFICTSRGMLPVKNKGEIGMYFVEDPIDTKA